MFLQGVLFTATILLCTAVSLSVQNSIEPVDLNYHCINIQDGQEINKSPVLLIHGVTTSLFDWSGVHQVLALRTKRRVCAVDLRNHGDSPWNNRSDVDALTVDIANFLEKHKIEKVNIIGHSLGGKIAVHYTLNNPNKINSLVIEDMRPNGVNAVAENRAKLLIKLFLAAIASVPEGQDEEGAKKSIVNFLNQKLKEAGSAEMLDDTTSRLFQIRLVNGKWQWKANLKVLINAMEHPEQFEESDGLYEGPTLFIYGTASPFDVGSDKDNILKLFPDAKLIPVKGAGHTIHGRHREFEDEVIRFLNSLEM